MTVSNETQLVLPVPTPPFFAIGGDAISDQLLDACATLFSENYGVWGALKGPSLSGKRVRMSAARLRKECLSIPQSSVLSVHFRDGKLLGHAIATVWNYDGGKVGWVTQLVVDSTVRRQGIATQLVKTLKTHKLFKDVTSVGLVSSHPASVSVLAKYCDIPINQVDFNFMVKNAVKILDPTPVDYLKNCKPYGRLYDENCPTDTVSSLFTQFYLDHREPLDALNVFKANGRWHFGELPEGHEFLILVSA